MRIRISNLDRSVSKEDLFKLFEEFGDVSMVQIKQSTNPGYREACNATVEMPDEWEAEAAIEELNGELFDGKIIRVRAEMSDKFIDTIEENDFYEYDSYDSDNGWEKIKRKKSKGEDYD